MHGIINAAFCKIYFMVHALYRRRSQYEIFLQFLICCMKTLLQAVFDELKRTKKIRTQTDFGNDLGLTRSNVSQLLQQSTPLPDKVKVKIRKMYGVSELWLASNGKRGSMFEDSQLLEQALKVATGNPDIKTEELGEDGNKAPQADLDNIRGKKQADPNKLRGKTNSNKNGNEDDFDLRLTNEFLGIYRLFNESLNLHARAGDKNAEAMLLMAKAHDRLTSIIEKMMNQYEHEGIHVNPLAD